MINPPKWQISNIPISYKEAMETMENMVVEIVGNKRPDTIWMLEHPPLYTMGTSAQEHDIIGDLPHPLHNIGRGGKITYHGPGQWVVYTMINLKNYHQDLHHFIWSLEEWIIAVLKEFSVEGVRLPGNPGIWVKSGSSQKPEKIGAIGVRVRKWITYHGFSLNVSPDMADYDPIIPCGIKGYRATSLESLGVHKSMGEVGDVLKKTFSQFLEKLEKN